MNDELRGRLDLHHIRFDAASVTCREVQKLNPHAQIWNHVADLCLHQDRRPSVPQGETQLENRSLRKRSLCLDEKAPGADVPGKAQEASSLILNSGHELLPGMHGSGADSTKDDLENSLAVFGSYFCELNSGSLARQLIPDTCGGFDGREVRRRAKSDFDLSIRLELCGHFQKQPAASEGQDVSREDDAIGGAFGGKVNSRPRVSPERGLRRVLWMIWNGAFSAGPNVRSVSE